METIIVIIATAIVVAVVVVLGLAKLGNSVIDNSPDHLLTPDQLHVKRVRERKRMDSIISERTKEFNRKRDEPVTVTMMQVLMVTGDDLGIDNIDDLVNLATEMLQTDMILEHHREELLDFIKDPLAVINHEAHKVKVNDIPEIQDLVSPLTGKKITDTLGDMTISEMTELAKK